MKHILKSILLLLVTVTVFSSCKQDLTIYDGQNMVEFAPATASVAKGTAATPGTYSAKVQIIGPQLTTEQVLDYTIDASSTGVQGTHYTIAGAAGKVTIPANSSFGYIVINAVPANITTGTRTVVLNLVGNTTLPASVNYKKFTLTITQ